MDSSYESTPACTLIHIDEDDRFTRVPVAGVFETSRDEMGKCSTERGHTLRVFMDAIGDSVIRCVHCPAEWTRE